jgi:hypothetical protein
MSEEMTTRMWPESLVSELRRQRDEALDAIQSALRERDEARAALAAITEDRKSPGTSSLGCSGMAK